MQGNTREIPTGKSGWGVRDGDLSSRPSRDDVEWQSDLGWLIGDEVRGGELAVAGFPQKFVLGGCLQPLVSTLNPET